ncbi:MAG: alpha-ketoacid dehydrogenase subunit beta [Chloroflexi bacterium]|nr:alpha-ketoacid dehydrogenase subunit beta [Chloroflexota bacterium]
MPMMTIAEALRQAIREEMQRDPRVFCIGEDIGVEGGFGGAFTVTLGLSAEFGHERIRDTPISEAAIAGVAIGAAMAGMRPIADVQYGDFALNMMDQLVNQAAKMRYMSGGQVSVPMVLRVPVGATSRGAQHAQSLEAFFCHVPGLKVVAPSTAYDAKGLLKSAIRDPNPVLVFEHKLLYGSKGARSERGAVSSAGEVPDGEYLVPIGQGAVRREGRDVTIVGKLLTVYRALEAAEALAERGIEVEVLDPRTLVPLDRELILASVRKTGRLVIAEEDNLTGGWAAEVAALVADEAFDWLDAPVKRVSAPDVPPPFAPRLEREYVPDADKIAAAVESLF